MLGPVRFSFYIYILIFFKYNLVCIYLIKKINVDLSCFDYCKTIKYILVI